MALRLAVGTVIAVGATAATADVNICGRNATIADSVRNALNLTYPGLEAVQAAFSAGDPNTACEALATYYATANTSWWLRNPNPPAPSNRTAGGWADAMVFNGTFWLAGVDLAAVVPRNPDGGLDWLDHGPRDDPEFMNCLNRHDSFVFLLEAWAATGNAALYGTFFDALVQDWVLHLPCPDALSQGAACVPAGLSGTPCSWQVEPDAQSCKTGTMESPWRSLEMGIRMSGAWPQSFFGMQSVPQFSTSARVLMVLAVAEHLQALRVDGGHPGRGTPNWEMTQWEGLVSATATWPELWNASGLQRFALTQLEALLDDGVYADGVETEQASGYDMGTAGDFFNVLQLLRYAGQPPPSQSFLDRVEAMWAYGTYVSDPLGCLPRNGDSDLCNSGYSATAVAYFNRSDWEYVHSNGATGSPPPTLSSQGPSSLFPWAGQVVMRSGFDRNATWLWFDVGPYGSSEHAHRDKLTIMLHARESMLIADSGRFAYAGTDLSATLHVQYSHNTTAHNTLTLDGCDQLPLPPLAANAVPASSVVFTPSADTAYGNMTMYDGLQGAATHARGVYFHRPTAPVSVGDGDWAVVVDVITSDRPRTVQAYWHTHPNATVAAIAPGTLVATVGGVYGPSGQPTAAQACLIPAPAGTAPDVAGWNTTEIVRGRYANATTGETWQGWYSQSYDDAWPASTLIYASSVGPRAVFAWLLVPTSTDTTACQALGSLTVTAVSPTTVTVTVSAFGKPAVQVQVPVAGA